MADLISPSDSTQDSIISSQAYDRASPSPAMLAPEFRLEDEIEVIDDDTASRISNQSTATTSTTEGSQAKKNANKKGRRQNSFATSLASRKKVRKEGINSRDAMRTFKITNETTSDGSEYTLATCQEPNCQASYNISKGKTPAIRHAAQHTNQKVAEQEQDSIVKVSYAEASLDRQDN